MLSQKYRKKSPSISSADSGLGCSVKNKLIENPLVKSKANCNQKFSQEASSTVNMELLRRGLLNSHEKMLGFRHNTTPVKIECPSDSENITSSQFSPLACSTQQLKKSEDTLDERDTNKYNIKKNKSKKKLKINILDNHLIHKDIKEEIDSDGYLSVVEVHKPFSSCSLSSDVDSVEEIQKFNSKNKIQDTRSENVSKTHKITSPKNILHGLNKDSNSMYLKLDDIDINKDDSKTSAVGSKKFKSATFENRKAAENNDAGWYQQRFNISSSDSESNETFSSIPRNAHVISSNIKDKNTINFCSETEGYEELVVPTNANFELCDDDEVYLLQIPKTINPKIMEGISFSLSEKSKFKLGPEKYYIRPKSHKSNFILTFANDMKKITPLATLKMEKHTKTKKLPEIVYEETRKQPLPKSMKVRHPFFGNQYESKVELTKQIKEKLQQAHQRFSLKQKKPKKVDKVNIDNELTSNREKEYGEFEIKKEVNSYEDFKSNKLYLNNNEEENKEIRVKTEFFNNEEFLFNKMPLKNKKKKKQKESEGTNEEFLVKKEPLEEHFPQNLKKRRKSIFSSTGILEALEISDFKADVSNIETGEPAAKKIKNVSTIKDDNESANLINSLLLSAKIKLEHSSNKKKNKRKPS